MHERKILVHRSVNRTVSADERALDEDRVLEFGCCLAVVCLVVASWW